jgi:hypothetical protein
VRRKIVFRPEAHEDIAEAVGWYESRADDLSSTFVQAFEAALVSVDRNPLLHAPVSGMLRRALLHRFPYGILYWCSDELIVVVGCAHWRQDPSGWRTRE